VPAPGSDVELLEAWRDGDRQAGQQLFVRHFDSVSRFFRNKVDSGVDDLIQRTFLACVESRERLRGEASFRTYLFAVARNVLCRHYRGKRRDDRIDFGVTSVHDLAPSPSVVVVQNEQQRALLDGLRRIPLECQIILELYYWERMTSAEVAQVLGVPHGTARTRIRRAKQLLEAQMSERLSDPGLRKSTMTDLDAWAASLREQLDRPAAGEAGREPQS
jgi:RNA polymerase sigma factor (sigma-70 family)